MGNNYARQTQRPSPTAILNPRCDPVFKSMFTKGTKESDFALKDFISTILGRTITDMQLVPNEEPVEILDEKQMSFDVNVTFDNGEKAELEMQGRNQDYDYASRAEIHAAKLLVSNNKRGSNYGAGKVYQISVVNFEFDKDDNSPLSWYNMRKENGSRLSDKLNVIFFDLIKIHKLLGKPIEMLSKLEKWGLFLSYADDERHTKYIDEIVHSEGGLMSAKSSLLTVSQDEINWARQNSIFIAQQDHNAKMYNAEKRGLERGMQQGLQKGLQEGEHNAKIEMARNALAMGLSVDQIVQLTGLPQKDIERL